MFFGSVQIASRLDSQSRFQMFTLFASRHIGGPGSIILRGQFRLITQPKNNTHALNLENCLLYLSSVISQFLTLSTDGFDLFYCLTMHTLYRVAGSWKRDLSKIQGPSFTHQPHFPLLFHHHFCKKDPLIS